MIIKCQLSEGIFKHLWKKFHLTQGLILECKHSGHANCIAGEKYLIPWKSKNVLYYYFPNHPELLQFSYAYEKQSATEKQLPVPMQGIPNAGN